MELQTPDQAQLDHTAPAAQDAATPLDQTPSYQSMSPQELVDHLAVLLQQEELPERKLVENIRGQFIRRRERLDPNDKEQRESFEVQELRLEGLLSTFREHDKKRQEALEQLYAENKVKKEALLQRFEDLFKSNEEGAEFGSLYSTFTAIRDEWNALGQLDPKDATGLNRRFYELRDQFYDLKAINDDLRQIDFKKNLEAKQAILAELRELDSVKDTIAAYRRLQELTAQWHELGPVSKEHRQEINTNSSSWLRLSISVIRSFTTSVRLPRKRISKVRSASVCRWKNCSLLLRSPRTLPSTRLSSRSRLCRKSGVRSAVLPVRTTNPSTSASVPVSMLSSAVAMTSSRLITSIPKKSCRRNVHSSSVLLL